MVKTVTHLQEYLRQFHGGSVASDDRCVCSILCARRRGVTGYPPMPSAY